MTDYDLPRPDPVVQALASGIVDAIRRDPSLRDQLRAIVLSAEADGWVSQADSPLGSRRHRAAVRAALASGDARARIVGKKFFLRRDAFEAELLRLGRMQVAKADTRKIERDALAEELGLEVCR